jgi:Lrp/AsnC ligand binding domain
VVTAYILIQTEVGKAAQVAKDIVEIKGVQQAEDVTGPYDVIARAEARNLDELGKLVVARVQAIDGITRTSPVRWCASSAARPELVDHLVVCGRQQERQQHGRIAAVGGERLRWRRPGQRRLRTALNCGTEFEDRGGYEALMLLGARARTGVRVAFP